MRTRRCRRRPGPAGEAGAAGGDGGDGGGGGSGGAAGRTVQSLDCGGRGSGPASSWRLVLSQRRLGGLRRIVGSVNGVAPGGEGPGTRGSHRRVKYVLVVQVRQRSNATANAVVSFIFPEDRGAERGWNEGGGRGGE